MENTEINIEQLFRNEFAEFQMRPASSNWYAIRYKMFLNQLTQFSLTTVNLYTVALITVMGLAVFHFLTKDTGKDVVYEIVGNEENRSDNQSTQPVLIIIDETDVTEQNSNSDKQDGENIEKPLNTQTGTKESIEPIERISPELSTGKSNMPDGQKMIGAIKMPDAAYYSSANQACANTKIDFYNTSKNAVNYEWSFGTAGISNAFQPSVVFTRPGLYPVTLKATNSFGVSITCSDTIEIFENPHANLFMPDLKLVGVNTPVRVANTSTNAVRSAWFVDDKIVNTNDNGQLIFEKPGNYSVKLKVWSANNCADSVDIDNVVVTPMEYTLEFPTAFSPSLIGAKGGAYTPGDETNDIFYPVYNGLESYNLEIYTREGRMVFKTNDPKVGWDGYYNRKLMPQAVYVWKATGTFGNGHSFSKAGSVTLIHNSR